MGSSSTKLLTQAEEGTTIYKNNEVPFGTFHNGRTILLEEPIWFFIVVILFFLSSGSAVALGIYGMQQWQSGEVYSSDGLDTATYVCSSLALVFLLIIVVTYIVLSVKKSLRVDERVLGEKFNSLHARFLASGAYNQIIEKYPDHAKDMLIENREKLKEYLDKTFGTKTELANTEAKRRAGEQQQQNIIEFVGNPGYIENMSWFNKEGRRQRGEFPESGRLPDLTRDPNEPRPFLGNKGSSNSPISLSRPRKYNPPLKKKKASPVSKKKKSSPTKKKSTSSKRK